MTDLFGTQESGEYAAIQDAYEGKFAQRSGVPYIQHIDEGLWVLDQIGASQNARLAYCLHPLCQGDSDLGTFDSTLASSPQVLMAAIEYRNTANAYLSHHWAEPNRVAKTSPLSDVNEMLLADKVQNFKDFEVHHLGTHPNSDALNAYFREWLKTLGVGIGVYRYFANGLKQRFPIRPGHATCLDADMSDSPLNAAKVRRLLVKKFPASKESKSRIRGMKEFSQGFTATNDDLVVIVRDRASSLSRSEASRIASDERVGTYAEFLRDAGFTVTQYSGGGLFPRQQLLVNQPEE